MSYFPLKSILFFAIPIIIQIAVVIGVTFLLKKMIRKNNENANGFSSSREAMHILDERFANGEIDDAEYIRKREMLKRQ